MRRRPRSPQPPAAPPPRLAVLARLAAGVAALALGTAGPAVPAGALVTVSLEASQTSVAVGASLDVSVFADLSQPIAGWGFDLLYDAALLSAGGAPAVGSDWMAVAAGDGDGLAAAAFPAGISGDAILLATLTLTADAVGTSVLSLETSDGDLTEGFVLDPAAGSGFDTLAPVTPLMLQIVPEPAPALLLALGLVGLARRRGRVREARSPRAR